MPFIYYLAKPELGYFFITVNSIKVSASATLYDIIGKEIGTYLVKQNYCNSPFLTPLQTA